MDLLPCYDSEVAERESARVVGADFAMPRRSYHRPNYLNQAPARLAPEAPMMAPARAPPERMPYSVSVHYSSKYDPNDEAPPRRNALRGVRPSRNFPNHELEEFHFRRVEQQHPVVAQQVPNVVNLADSEGDEQARAVLRLGGGGQVPGLEDDDDDDDDGSTVDSYNDEDIDD